MTTAEIINNLLAGNGIKSVERNTNGAWVCFDSYVSKYYSDNFNYDGNDAYSVAKSIIAYRMNRMWLDANAPSDNVTIIAICFICYLSKLLQNWYDSKNFALTYEIAIKDIVIPFFDIFDIEY